MSSACECIGLATADIFLSDSERPPVNKGTELKTYSQERATGKQGKHVKGILRRNLLKHKGEEYTVCIAASLQWRCMGGTYRPTNITGVEIPQRTTSTSEGIQTPCTRPSKKDTLLLAFEWSEGSDCLLHLPSAMAVAQ